MKQKKNLRQIFSVFLTCMMIIGVALVNDHIFVEGEGKPQAEQQVQEGEPQQGQEQEQEQGDPEKPGEQEQGQGEIQEGKPQQEPEQGQEPGQQEQGQGDSGKPGELPGKPEEVKQRGGQELTDITISELEFLYNGTDMAKKMDDQDELTMCGYWNTYRFNMEWDATSYKNGLKSGDYFIAKLPTQLNFLPPGSPETVEIKDQSGNTVAEGKIFELKGEKRFAVKATFTDKVEGISLVKGEFHADVKFAYRNIDPHGEKPSILEVKIGNNFISRKIWIGNKPYAQEKHFEKWGSAVTGNPVQVQWTIRLNHKKNKYVDWKLEDIILPYHDTTLANSQYIPDSFIIKEVELNDWGEITKVKKTFEYEEIKECFQFENNNKFTFTFKENIFGGPINGRQYVIYYKTDYIPGKTLTNSLEIFGYQDVQGTKEKLTDETKKKPSFISNETGGSVEGDLKGQIKIIKVDGRDTTIKLKGAEFTIKKAGNDNNPVIERKTTDVNGEAIFDKLEPGDYIIEETEAPKNYVKNTKKYTVTVKADGTVEYNRAVLQDNAITIPNKPETRDITVEKKWVDNNNAGNTRPELITVILYANGQLLQNHDVRPDANGKWTLTLGDLEKYDVNGKEIKYTVKEVGEANGKITIGGNEYTVTYTGSMENGFVITNKKKSNPPNPGGGGSGGGGQSGGGSGGTGGDDSNKPKPNDPKPNDPKPSDDSTGMGGATPPDGSVVPNDSTTATNTVAPKNHKTPKNPVLTDKQGVKKTAQASRRLPKTGEGANPTLYAWMLGALGSMLVLVGYRKRKTVK